jgi:hypothetical protein
MLTQQQLSCFLNVGLFVFQRDFRSRIELIQDAEFVTACNRVRFSRDGRSMAAVGTYR